MYETIRISELDPESLELVKTFVENMQEMCENSQKVATGQEAVTLGEMARESAEMLQKVKFDIARRGVAHQAAAAAIQRQNRIGQGKQSEGVKQLELLLKSKHNYTALNQQGGFGDKLDIMRERQLAILRDTLSRHVGTNASQSPNVNNSNFRIRKIADYVAMFDENALYTLDNDRFEGFRKLIKAMRKDVMHKGALQSALNAPKTAVTPQDITIPGITIKHMSTCVHKGITIPYSLDLELAATPKAIRIDIPGLTGGGAPMTKHLKEFLDSFGNSANAYDAINYCKSWLIDLKSIPLQNFSASVNAKTREAARIYGKSQLRWEFVMSNPPRSSGATYICHHIVAKGIKTGINPYHT